MDLEKWQWAWLAGIFEGEGSIGFTNDRSAQVRIVMTDQDVVETIERLFPSPRGLRTYEFTAKKTQWCWQLSSRDDVRAFLTGIQPFLHARRNERVEDALARLASNLGGHAKRTHCLRGHPFSGENLYITKNGTRHCKTCAQERDRNRRRKH